MKSASLSEHPDTIAAKNMNDRARRNEMIVMQTEAEEEQEFLARGTKGRSNSSSSSSEVIPDQQQPTTLTEEEKRICDEQAELTAQNDVKMFEHRMCMFAMFCGFWTAHTVVYRYFYKEDVRLSYRLEHGFTQDLLKRREVLAGLDEFVGESVMGFIVDPKKQKYKLSAA
jgi:hypothetical protein